MRWLTIISMGMTKKNTNEQSHPRQHHQKDDDGTDGDKDTDDVDPLEFVEKMLQMNGRILKRAGSTASLVFAEMGKTLSNLATILRGGGGKNN